jgi:hypothetical protein
MNNVSHLGSLVRAMVLRAQLAESRGDHANAARWARSVTTLWSEPDADLAPITRQMSAIANRR